MDSTNAEAAPRMAMTHIQKMAPGPPRQIADETPTMFPVPTREAVETIKAPNDERLFASNAECFNQVADLRKSQANGKKYPGYNQK